MQTAAYSDSVFINCPFDREYELLLYSLVFTVYACGFIPRSALEEDDSSEIRLEKIARLIEACRYGIHDISKTDLDSSSGMPRFNMPFELGLFWGAKRYGPKVHKEKVAIVFEKEKYSYQKFLSDINGVDVKAHNNNPEICVKAVRNWLFTNSKRKTIPPPASLLKYWNEFMNNKLPAILAESQMQLHELTFNDYCFHVVTALEASSKTNQT
jgi:hypothetical protein